MKICKVEGCNGKHKAKGYCNKHYKQLLRHGKILERSHKDLNEIIEYEDYAEIVLYNKHNEEVARALIDLDDVDRVKNYKWSLTHEYVYNRDKSRLHRYIMDCPEDMVVDHINHNPLDNRKSNLRICTQQQNSMNKSKHSNNISGVAGVSWKKDKHKWCARIIYNRKNIHIGYFDTLEEAIEARKQAEIEYFGEYRNQDEEDVS